MSTRLYPLFQRGNPQLRIFLPNFWMKIIKSKEPLPPNMVLFQTSIEMTDYDIRNYLEKIYQVPVIDVKTTIKEGLIRNAYGKGYLVKEDDYKEALVTMPKHYKFSYPNIITDDIRNEVENARKMIKDQISAHRGELTEEQKEVKNRMHGVPDWFH